MIPRTSVLAHLGPNRTSFGGIDKTLSGFDYRSYRSDLASAGDEEDEREALDAYRPKKEKASKRALSSPALCEPYQWLVPLLARPMTHHGQVVETLDQLMSSAVGGF